MTERLREALQVVMKMKRPSIEQLLIVRGYKTEAQAMAELRAAYDEEVSHDPSRG